MLKFQETMKYLETEVKYENATELGLPCRALLCSLCCCLLCINNSNNGINFSFLKLAQPMLFCHHGNFYILPSTLNNLIDKINKREKKIPIKCLSVYINEGKNEVYYYPALYYMPYSSMATQQLKAAQPNEFDVRETKTDLIYVASIPFDLGLRATINQTQPYLMC